jgi:putative tryptophan/tyrosine transport system substrate-binding protein
MLDLRRREFITLIGAGAAACPLAARAQHAVVPVIGFLHTRSQEAYPSYAAFLKGIEQTGFVEGQSVRIEYRWAAGQYDRLPAMAADLVRRGVNVLVAGGGEPSPRAAKAATSTIPILFVMGSDPVKAGLVESYRRPGGNITGINILTDLLEAKRLGLLHDLLPDATTVGFLWNPRFASAAQNQMPEAQEAARGLGLTLRALPVSTVDEIDAAFDTIRTERILALAVSADPFLDSNRDKIIGLAARYSVPTIYQFREHAVAGGLMSYGIDLDEVYRQAGLYAGRLLKGEKPADLPVLQPTKFEFVINLNTARAFGISFPPGLLAIADEVIER